MSAASSPRPKAAAPPGPRIVEVPWRRVRPSASNPREHFDPQALEELAGSLAAIGQVVPALACPVADDPRIDYELIDGERRWTAIQRAGLGTIRLEVVDEADPELRFRRSVVANLSRAGHHPMEIAEACARMRKTMPVSQIARALGRAEAWVYQHLALLNLEPAVRARMHPEVPKNDRLPFSAGLRLSRLTPADQLEALRKIEESGLSMLRATNAAIESMQPQPSDVANPRARPGIGAARGRDPNDHIRVGIARAVRAGHGLEELRPERIGEMARGRAEIAAELRAALARLRDLADEKLRALPGAHEGGR